MATVLDRTSAPIAIPHSDETPNPALAREPARYVWAVVRLALGWTFLWPFLDKMFGLHHQTASGQAWIHGGSPTAGYLAGATGPLAGFYHSFAGAGWANWGFMLGLLCIGVALLAGVGVRVAAASGAVLVLLMWSASFPPQSNPFLDDHVIYALVLIGLALVGAGNTLGFGRWWANTTLVRNHQWLT